MHRLQINTQINYVFSKSNPGQRDLRFLLRCCAAFEIQTASEKCFVQRPYFSDHIFLTKQLPCCIDLGNLTASENIFLRAVAQFPKQVSAFVLRPFFSDHIFFDEAVALLHRFGKSDCFRKYFFEGCCAVSKAGLSFCTKTFFFRTIFFLTKQLPCCIDLGNLTASENIFLRAVAQSPKQSQLLY